MLKQILIITEKFDPHADHVIRELKTAGIGFFRLNTNNFHTEIKVSGSTMERTLRFTDDRGRSHSFPQDTLCVWYRKPVDPTPHPALSDAAAQGLALGETLELLTYLSVDRRVRWFNNPHDNRFSQRKLPQLFLAQELGLTTPRTLITNQPDLVRDFSTRISGRLLCKSMKEQGFRGETDGYFIFSRKVTPDELEAACDQVAYCPTFFQEYIEKAHELRITIIGDDLYCCAIDSQKVEGAETDWRRLDPSRVPHNMVSLPAEIEDKLRLMMVHYGLSYAAFDMIVTPAGEYVFLEMNPNGQWLWIELMTGAPMTRSIIRMLTL
jgi:hypothetical protein